jgi:hypothetical protein
VPLKPTEVIECSFNVPMTPGVVAVIKAYEALLATIAEVAR